jgi:hypothetical protein
MSKFSRTAIADAITGKHPLHPLATDLLGRHEKLEAKDSQGQRLDWLGSVLLQRNDHEWLRRFGRKVVGRTGRRWGRQREA